MRVFLIAYVAEQVLAILPIRDYIEVLDRAVGCSLCGTMAVNTVSRLPPELQLAVIQTFRSEGDLVFVWTVLRNVNHFFRQMSEDWVRQRHLHRMAIVPSPALLLFGSNFDYLCEFAHASPTDPARAVFNIAEGNSIATQRLVTRALHEACQRYPIGVRPEPAEGVPQSDQEYQVPSDQHVNPPGMVIVRRLANDTEMVDWSVDFEKMQLELNWRKTIDRLIQEEKLRGVLTKKWLSRAKAMRIEAQSNGRTPTMAIMQIAFQTRGARDESSSIARTKRIQAQKALYQEQPRESSDSKEPSTETKWQPSREDIAGFERVEMLTQLTNSLEYSDDD